MALPNPGMTINPSRTALLVTDPQNDFLSPEGVTWGVVGESVIKNGTIENIERLFRAAKGTGMPVFVSPHYYFPTDHGWKFEGALEALMHEIGMYDRPGALDLTGFRGSGPISSSGTRSSSKTGRRSSPARTRSTAPKPTISFCS